MGADRLAFRTRRAFPCTTVELGKHRLVLDDGWVDVADSRLRHMVSSWYLRGAGTLNNRDNLLFSMCDSTNVDLRVMRYHRGRGLFTTRGSGVPAAETADAAIGIRRAIIAMRAIVRVVSISITVAASL